MAKDVGREVATADEARAILGIEKKPAPHGMFVVPGRQDVTVGLG